MWQTIKNVADQQGYTGLKRILFMAIGPVLYVVSFAYGYARGFVIGVRKGLKKS